MEVLKEGAINEIVSKNKKVSKETVELKNVITEDGKEDLTVEVVTFNERNDTHVDFAFSYSDMALKAPSEFANITEASLAYVENFMVHKADDVKDKNSAFYKVMHDKRAARTLFHSVGIQQALRDFFDGV